MSEVRCERDGDDRGAGGGGGRSGRWASALPGLRRASVAVGFARQRTVRLLQAARSLLSRRAYCWRCEQTHVLLPAWAVARRRDGTEVIGRALLAKANRHGRRTIAAALQRPPGTVRGRLRTFARRAEPVAATARLWARALDPSADHATAPGSSFVQVVDALGRAAGACRLRLEITASPWELAVALGGLLHGRPRDPPWF
ncbi:MAG: hypothetical protein ACP5H2_12580 [Solirubrobacteraceae bacterium]